MKIIIPSLFIRLVLFLFLVIALPNIVVAAPSPEPKQKLFALLNNINIINADFTQTVTNKSGKIIQQQTGKVQLKKPYLLNWQILSPDQLQIVIDGKKVWHYDIDLEQVMVKELNTVTNSGSKIADLLLGDLQQSLNNFTVNQVPASYCNNATCFELNYEQTNPEESEASEEIDSFVKAYLGFDNNKLTMLKLYDQLDQATVFKFSQFKSTVDPKRFEFVIPQGVDVITD